ncbi:hypothetical protein IVB13_07480 [Bradyrhizobium sp. 17]|nr:hypothetical protein [Bradyrhizobium sp. 17]
MKQKSGTDKAPAVQMPNGIRRQTQCSAGRENPHRAGRTTPRGEQLGAVPPRGHLDLDVLLLVSWNFSRGQQAPAGGRYGAAATSASREASALKEVVADFKGKQHAVASLPPAGSKEFDKCGAAESSSHEGPA